MEIAVDTGGASGIGLALAQIRAKSGTRAIGADIEFDRAETAAKEIRQHGGEMHYARSGEIEGTLARFHTRWGDQA